MVCSISTNNLLSISILISGLRYSDLFLDISSFLYLKCVISNFTFPNSSLWFWCNHFHRIDFITIHFLDLFYLFLKDSKYSCTSYIIFLAIGTKNYFLPNIMYLQLLPVHTSMYLSVHLCWNCYHTVENGNLSFMINILY